MMGTQAGSDIFRTRHISEHLKLLPANCLSFDELYAHYADSGFLYPEKLKKLTPHLDLIRENWTRGWAAGREILLTQVYREQRLKKMGTVTVWKSTRSAWQSQHLTSQNHAAGILYLLLYAQDEGIEMNYGSGQNWFSPTNGFAMKIYGRMDRVLGAASADSCLLNYLQVDPARLPPSREGYEVTRCSDTDLDEVRYMANLCRGSTYCRAEELDRPDLGLSRLDRQFTRFGLGRRRHLWLAREKKSGKPRGMIVAYRGPFGFNFSFLENRCDLMTDPFLAPGERTDICRMLIHRAARVYFDRDPLPYPLTHLVVMAGDACAAALEGPGTVKTRQYVHGIWLDQGFEKWKKYMQRIFSPVIKRYERHIPCQVPGQLPDPVPIPVAQMPQGMAMGSAPAVHHRGHNAGI